MTKDELTNEYFEWMYQLVTNSSMSYRKLLFRLYKIDFTYILPMDENREKDVINLRYRFAYEKAYEDEIVAVYLDNRPCSVLEMMIALAIRCEDNIMANPEFGDRTGQWFWIMIKNLGLETMTDFNFSKSRVDLAISNFLKRDYEKNGKGGLFVVDECSNDFRDMEIWYQMCWYLNSIL
jgi:hypothetical protein